MTTPRLSSYLLSVLILYCAGCATHRASVPEIDETPRIGLTLNQPVLVAVHDARADKSNSEAVLSAIEQGLVRAYGTSIEPVGYFEQVPENQVAVRIRLMANGADFESRIISVVAITNGFATARREASSGWQPVVSVAAEQSSITTALSTENWWIGTSWLELEIEDTRGVAERITLPIAAEEREPNTFGYRSASNVSRRAWGRASQQLFRVMDSLLMTLRDQGF